MNITQLKAALPRELLASVVVFLVALPLCMGIAIASGMPPAKGLITGIIGGVVVGFLAGSPLQVSGPAAGLAVLVFELVRQHGVAMLGPILLLAGLLQLLAGRLRLGCWFRVTAPAVVYGMLAGIGVLIVLSQIHVMFDTAPQLRGCRTCWNSRPPWPQPCHRKAQAPAGWRVRLAWVPSLSCGAGSACGPSGCASSLGPCWVLQP